MKNVSRIINGLCILGVLVAVAHGIYLIGFGIAQLPLALILAAALIVILFAREVGVHQEKQKEAKGDSGEK